jgi:hypothetical protein
VNAKRKEDTHDTTEVFVESNQIIDLAMTTIEKIAERTILIGKID